MNRRKAREQALQMLFQAEFSGKADPMPRDVLPQGDKEQGDRKFAEELFLGTMDNLPEIDRVIQHAADNWDVQRMAAVDRNILRFAVYEILYRKDIPHAVTINEALEVAKKFSSLESVPFINGLLDKVSHEFSKQ